MVATSIFKTTNLHAENSPTFRPEVTSIKNIIQAPSSGNFLKPHAFAKTNPCRSTLSKKRRQKTPPTARNRHKRQTTKYSVHKATSVQKTNVAVECAYPRVKIFPALAA
ncbi:MAG: hypothetical protein H7836_17515 [Magnetococcus sp. YQC-3]